MKPNFDYSNYLRNPSEYSFFISATNADQVLSEIKNLKNNKSTGPSIIPTKFLKLFQTSLSQPISLIANICFSTGNFSSALKTANAIPVFKKDDHTLCSNYRPIFLLFNISKIIEKLIHVPRLT